METRSTTPRATIQIIGPVDGWPVALARLRLPRAPARAAIFALAAAEDDVSLCMVFIHGGAPSVAARIGFPIDHLTHWLAEHDAHARTMPLMAVG